MESKDDEYEQFKKDKEREVADLKRIMHVNESRQEDIKTSYRALEQKILTLEIKNR